MKKIFALFLDLLFFLSTAFILLSIALVGIYYREKDITVINTVLQTELIPSLLIAYGVIVAFYLFYAVLITRLLGATVGQKLLGLMLQPKEKRSLFNIFLYTCVAPFWEVLLFPVGLFFFFTKKDSLTFRLSHVKLEKIAGKLSIRAAIFTSVFALMLIASAGIGTYVYKSGVGTLIEQYTDYKKQTEKLVENLAFQDALVTLEKYKQYNGETPDYFYLQCTIKGNLSIELSNLDICKKAAETNTDTKRTVQIVVLEARILAANGNYEEAVKKYEDLWTNHSIRSIEMKNYVMVLSEVGRTDDAVKILDEIAKNADATDFVTLQEIGLLYERVNKLDVAQLTYETILKNIKEGEKVEFSGEILYNIAVIQYKTGKYAEANVNFEKAKTLNKDFSDAADSYIILISKLGNSVTK